MKANIFGLIPLILAACGADQGADIEYLNFPGIENTPPISVAVRVGDTLYLSGFLAYDPETGGILDEGIQAETRATLENIAVALETFGSSMERVVKCTVFLADIAEWGAMNEVYTTFFPNKPARTALGVSGLALGARVEIECIAVVD
jgi:2-iminobutanoate/2-iminopropanoate deaminase